MVKNNAKVDAKAIRVFIKNQIESEYPRFGSLKRKQKQEVVEQVRQSVAAAQKAGKLELPILSAEERVGLGRMKTQATVSAQVVFSQMVGILKVMAGLRSVPKVDDRARQEVLPFAVNA